MVRKRGVALSEVEVFALNITSPINMSVGAVMVIVALALVATLIAVAIDQILLSIQNRDKQHGNF